MIVLPHLGLGDHIICNAIIWSLVDQHHAVRLICLKHNASTLADMFGPFVQLLVADNDGEAIALSRMAGDPVLALGSWSGKPFTSDIFDQSFYAQAGLPFDQRWAGFRLHQPLPPQLPVPGEPYSFAHQDTRRKFLLRDIKPWMIQPDGLTSMVRYLDILQHAQEIHCINSSWALLVDSLSSLADKPKFLHLYARCIGEVPTFRNNWTILK